ncbi:MAG: hypothetical protein JWM06_3013 [Actinomycetia bacterium]|nr:hypothetical protein [Actinomycetes bacterium]
MPEILARIHRGARRFIVVYFPEGWVEPDSEESFELMPDEPYWWRAQAVDLTMESSER